jgi:Fic family protein
VVGQLNKKREINYKLIREKIKQLIEARAQLTHALIQGIHALVMNEERPIGYRVGIGAPPIINQVTRECRYWPPASDIYSIHQEVQEALNEFDQREFSSPIEKAAQLHWWLVKIHPFDDGNGRTARLLVCYTLLSCGYHTIDYKELEQYTAVNRHAYDDALHDSILSYRKLSKVSSKLVGYLECWISSQKKSAI